MFAVESGSVDPVGFAVEVDILSDLMARVQKLERKLDFSSLAKRCMQAVVKIEGRIDHETLKRPIIDPLIIGNMMGTGFFIHDTGLIVTNHHVIDGISEIKVDTLKGDQGVIATVVGSDMDTDLALLQIEGSGFPYLSFADSSPEIGQMAIAVGHPIGLDFSFTKGVVSGIGRDLGGFQRFEDYIQTDVLITHGSSGGPLLNFDGEIIGVQSAVLENLGTSIPFSISSTLAMQVLVQLMDQGIVERAYFGANLSFIERDVAQALYGKEISGFAVHDLLKESPCALSGLQLGDLILEYDGVPADDLHFFRQLLGMSYLPNDEMALTVLRDGETLDFSVTLGAEVRGEGKASEKSKQLGLHVDTLSAERAYDLGYDFSLEGALVTKVQKGSLFSEAGIHPQSVITRVMTSFNEGISIRTSDDFLGALETLEGKVGAIFEVMQPGHASHAKVWIDLPDFQVVEPECVQNNR